MKPNIDKFNQMNKGMNMSKGEMLSSMLITATKAHAGQKDRGGKPYILHPLAVMSSLKLELGDDDEELLVIALGHDLLEDTDITTDELKAMGMSDRVVDGIAALTKVPGQSYEDYVQRVLSSEDAMKVKLHDLFHNIDTRRLKKVTDKDMERVKKYREFASQILIKQMHL